MNRLALFRLIRGWIIVAAPAIGGCVPVGGFGGECPTKVHRSLPIDPPDAASAADGGADGGSDDCVSRCRKELQLDSFQDVVSCGPSKDDAGALLLDCLVTFPCEGRRPASLESTGAPTGGDAIGRHFARMAHIEEASVTAFVQLAEELAELGAPRSLVRAALSAADDERHHARMTTRLARRFGAVPARASVGARPHRTLEALAIENAIEGCVRETYGAVAATWQSMAATDEAVRAVMDRIARDETRHAELAWEIARWADARLDSSSRTRVTQAMEDAASQLARDLKVEPSRELLSTGVPSASVAAKLFGEMRRDLLERAAA